MFKYIAIFYVLKSYFKLASQNSNFLFTQSIFLILKSIPIMFYDFIL